MTSDTLSLKWRPNSPILAQPSVVARICDLSNPKDHGLLVAEGASWISGSMDVESAVGTVFHALKEQDDKGPYIQIDITLLHSLPAAEYVRCCVEQMTRDQVHRKFEIRPILWCSVPYVMHRWAESLELRGWAIHPEHKGWERPWNDASYRWRHTGLL